MARSLKRVTEGLVGSVVEYLPRVSDPPPMFNSQHRIETGVVVCTSRPGTSGIGRCEVHRLSLARWLVQGQPKIYETSSLSKKGEGREGREEEKEFLKKEEEAGEKEKEKERSREGADNNQRVWRGGPWVETTHNPSEN